MSKVIRISACFNYSLHRTDTQLRFSYDHLPVSAHFSESSFKTASLATNSIGFSKRIHEIGGHVKALINYGEEGCVQPLDSSSSPRVAVELEPISSETQFDRVIAEAQQLEDSLVIVWMASWCRKCIYLKPKLEKLAADYYSRIRFYCVDVNSVPHKLVVRAGVTKMPTIQLWKDSRKQAEVIGGHKAYLVVNEVREMIENEDSI